MPVFKTFFKVIRSSLPSILIYIVIFIAISVIVTASYSTTVTRDFSETAIKYTVIDRDGGSALINGLRTYLAKSNTLVDLPDDTERLQDELFYRNVEYIIIVPEGFSENFGTDNSVELETVVVPDSASAQYMSLLVNQYLDTASLYQTYTNMTDEQRTQAIADDLSMKTPVAVQDSRSVDNSGQIFLFFYQYFAYIMIAILILGISTIMIVFNQPDLKRRNLCSPLTQSSMNAQLTLGCGGFALICWSAIIALSLLLYGKNLLQSGLLPLLCLNSFIFTIVCLAIAFCVGTAIKNTNALSAVANVLSLGMSFLCGVFVSQDFMSPSVLRVSAFLPAYWYVKANTAIGELPTFSSEYLSPIYTDMLIQLGFAAAVFSIALLISKQKQLNGK